MGDLFYKKTPQSPKHDLSLVNVCNQPNHLHTMKKLVTIITLFALSTIAAQDVEKSITISEDLKISGFGFTADGSPHISTYKKIASTKSKEAEFTRFNKESLEADLTFKHDELFVIRKNSLEGEKFLYQSSKVFNWSVDDPSNVLNQDGTTQSFEGEDWIPEEFTLLSDFVSKDYYIALGYEQENKLLKKKEERAYKLLRRDLKTFELIYKDFKLTEENPDKEDSVYKHEYIEHSNENFTLLTKKYSKLDDKDDYPSQVEYILSLYNYEGVLQETRILKNQIEDKRLRYKRAETGLEAYKEVIVRVRGDTGMENKSFTMPRHISSGNVYNDLVNKAYYTYGIVSGDRKTKNKCVFMLDKFDYTGKKIWSKSYEQPTNQKKGEGFKEIVTTIRLVDTGVSLGIALADVGNDYVSVVKVNKTNGEITSKKDLGGLKRNAFLIYANLNSNKLITTYSIKEAFGKKIAFELETLMAYSLNTEFQKFIDSKIGLEKKLVITSNITHHGIVTIDTNHEDGIVNISKFNWKQESSTTGDTK